MTFLQTIIYAIVQGITELFPISSVGHGIILPYVLGWTNVSSNPQLLPMIALLHLGTAVALLLYFWRDWVNLISSLWMHKPRERRLLGLIVVATIPAAIIGKLFESKLRELFPSPVSAGIFLLINGLILFLADWYRRRRTAGKGIDEVGYGQSFMVGVAQVLALIPGFSRSGVTMTASLGLGLSYEESFRFSALLSTPLIFGANVLELPKLLKSGSHQIIQMGFVGAIFAGIVALLATTFLMRYFKTSEVRALRPFGWYCVIIGAVVVVLALLHIHF